MEDSKLVIEWPTSTCLAVRRANTKPVVVVVVFFGGGGFSYGSLCTVLRDLHQKRAQLKKGKL